ncbi:MAG TPA: class I SAM-dependent methyltransferase [Flavobacterium sp.]|nr:class I SAM-dependent methyltransferase [Flavobacterium sp.]
MNPIVRKVYYALPVKFRYLLRRIIYLPSDIFRDKNELVPPKGMIFTGRGDYRKVGEATFEYFRKHGVITPQSYILDIGSGIGRMAVPFTKYLDETGRYEGFDIVKMGVDWCTQNISSKYPNFRFKNIELKNDLYNLSTNKEASGLRFPYPDNHFDFVFLTSVFTHMLPKDVEHYISEIKRVLKPGKRCFATFFVLDKQSEASMITKGSKSFGHHFGNYSLMNKKVKEANVAYQKDYIFELLKSHDLELVNFFRGFWSGLPAEELGEHQDVILFKK